MPTNHFRGYTCWGEGGRGGCCFLKLNLVTVFTTICYISLIYLVFPFDFIFYKIIPPRVTIIKFNQFVNQPAMACSKLTIETLEQGAKYVQA